ncbi:MAG: indolepyruvate ferredoxin oxidoreductase family protein [Gammaproteobacteria bacterium AqS3]|nr:indolepyruvate ferredoxin oxidoreductase family protein [Gammaproteobacteria bacterium AqS3]
MRDGVALSDKYLLETGQAYMTGVQALVRLPLLQRRLDRLAGHSTAGFISGYRGSPLGSYDKQLMQVADLLEQHDIVFKPGVNEDLGATAVWGTQHVPLFEGARCDGVFGIWYGKGPGVDRTGDVFKHANMAGTSPLGGVLAVAGDDLACKSSTMPNQSEFSFMDAEIPALVPSTVGELIEMGVRGFALSRYAGCWVGLKTISDIMDAAASVPLHGAEHFGCTTPDLELPQGGLHIRPNDSGEAQEARHRHHRLPAVQAFARVNQIDRLALDSPRARLGIAASGKGFLHVLDSLRLLGISEAEALSLGLRIWKVGLVWPLDAEGARAFAGGLESVLVVEERRDVIEHQLKAALYALPDGQRPRISGKHDESGAPLLRDILDLNTARVALAIFNWLPASARTEARSQVAAHLAERFAQLDRQEVLHVRAPYFCAGCPHNHSTKVPEGSRALAGVGCHYMARWMDRETEFYSHMGGEGITWMGQQPFTDEPHIFANLGDGTYFHSGLLAIRQAVAANLPITYKVLYNDAVAMTGGQSIDGSLTPLDVVHQVRAEGVEKVVMVSDDPKRWRSERALPADVTVHHRDDLAEVQETLRAYPGVSVMVYDQVCATENRRRRKRGIAAPATERFWINPEVCEGCGDCSVQSNCIAIEPLATELGTKRTINQSACNIDASCARGFCPSFVSVEGAAPRRSAGGDIDSLLADLPDAEVPELGEAPFNILLTGIGGLGVTSLSGILGMAAHIDELEISSVDQIGLAQRGGDIHAHLRLARRGADICGPRIPLGEADTIIAADAVTAHGRTCLPLCHPERTRCVLNSALMPTAEFTLNNSVIYRSDDMRSAIERTTLQLDTLDAGALAQRLLGDGVYINMILLGAAWQQGAVPLSHRAIECAIDINGIAVENNQRAFSLGRAWALGRLDSTAASGSSADASPFDLSGFVRQRTADLAAYQDHDYAEDYRQLIAIAAEAERDAGGDGRFAEAVARAYFKLKAYKDEYEIARMYSDPAFRRRLDEAFEGVGRVSLHLAPPLIARRDAVTGVPRKMRFGAWIFPVLEGLVRLKFLRGTALDPFGYTLERRTERRLVREYAQDIRKLCTELDGKNLPAAAAIAELPLSIRGFGHVKMAAIEHYQIRREELMRQREIAEPVEVEV